MKDCDDMHIYNLVSENSKEMIIWKVERKIGITLEGFIRTLKFQVPEYNFFSLSIFCT
jgi:hypothetical protein